VTFNEWMNAPLFTLLVVVTPWKILGYGGGLMFFGRWIVQAWHRKRTGSREIPTLFWILSLIGAGLQTSYFIWGKNDSVGILATAGPALIAAYNLVQDLRQKRLKAK
jgi:lipid-A-disaccharide synthase-like uncharacterized protein